MIIFQVSIVKYKMPSLTDALLGEVLDAEGDLFMDTYFFHVYQTRSDGTRYKELISLSLKPCVSSLNAARSVIRQDSRKYHKEIRERKNRNAIMLLERREKELEQEVTKCEKEAVAYRCEYLRLVENKMIFKKLFCDDVGRLIADFDSHLYTSMEDVHRANHYLRNGKLDLKEHREFIRKAEESIDKPAKWRLIRFQVFQVAHMH